MDQRTDEWFQARLGKVTASRIADVMARTKSGYGASRKNYMMELLCQRLTGQIEQGGYTNAAMMRGTELEPMARGAYEGINKLLVDETGFVDHPDILMAGASPDGLVGDTGLIEIKCPNTAQHVEFLRTGQIEQKYQYQMTFQMLCTKRNWCDFVSFDDRLPTDLQYKCLRFHYDSDMAMEITKEVSAFLNELDQLEEEMKALMLAA